MNSSTKQCLSTCNYLITGHCGCCFKTWLISAHDMATLPSLLLQVVTWSASPPSNCSFMIIGSNRNAALFFAWCLAGTRQINGKAVTVEYNFNDAAEQVRAWATPGLRGLLPCTPLWMVKLNQRIRRPRTSTEGRVPLSPIIRSYHTQWSPNSIQWFMYEAIMKYVIQGLECIK